MGGSGSTPSGGKTELQKVSREHHIARGPGGAVFVAGGKYTTARKMGEEIVDFALKEWKSDWRSGQLSEPLPSRLRPTQTRRTAMNPAALPEAIEQMRLIAAQHGIQVPPELVRRYGALALEVLELEQQARAAAPAAGSSPPDAWAADSPEGFPALLAQLRFAIRHEMVVRLEDFYLRRIPLFLARKDHGLPWAEALAQVWAEERGLSPATVAQELASLQAECARRSHWGS